MKFREYWPLYLRAHSRPATRAIHYGATVIGVGSAAIAAATLTPWPLAGIAVAYALAIGAHRFVERNRSLIRINAVWGAMADLRMFWLALTGGLGRELEKVGIAKNAPRTASVVWAGGPARHGSRKHRRRDFVGVR